MSAPPVRCVVDTNVAVTANGRDGALPPSCVAECARALDRVMRSGHLFIDDSSRIVAEYRTNLSAKGQPGPGDAFLKWLLTNEWSVERVTRVVLTPMDTDPNDFEESPRPPVGITYDPSDRKYLAVAAAHPGRPPILQALDSKWWGWKDALESSGVTVYFLCPEEIAATHSKKTSRR